MCSKNPVWDVDSLEKVIDTKIADVNITDEISLNKLRTALRAMVLAILSTQMRDLAQQAFAQLQ